MSTRLKWCVGACALFSVMIAVGAPGAGAHAAERGCVEELLRPPHEGSLGTYIEHPGGKQDGAGRGQEIVIHIQYESVAGCESYGRTSEARLEVKTPGSGWTTPAKLGYWDHITQGVGAGSRGPIEGGWFIPWESSLPSACVRGSRPKYRVAVKTHVKLIDSRKTVGTSPISYRPVAYRPASAARC